MPHLQNLRYYLKLAADGVFFCIQLRKYTYLLFIMQNMIRVWQYNVKICVAAPVIDNIGLQLTKI